MARHESDMRRWLRELEQQLADARADLAVACDVIRELSDDDPMAKRGQFEIGALLRDRREGKS